MRVPPTFHKKNVSEPGSIHLPTESESPWLMPVTPLPIQTIAMRLPSLCVPTSHLWGHGLSLPWHPCCQEWYTACLSWARWVVRANVGWFNSQRSESSLPTAHAHNVSSTQILHSLSFPLSGFSFFFFSLIGPALLYPKVENCKYFYLWQLFVPLKPS